MWNYIFYERKEKGSSVGTDADECIHVAAAGSQRGKTEHDDTAEVCEKRL